MSPPHGRTPLQRRTLRNTVLGVTFFVLGVIGLIVPVMPQMIFFFLSALFFSLVSPRLRRALRRFRQRHPSVQKAYVKWREKSRQKRLKLIRKARKLRHDLEERVDEATGHHHSRRE
jgi:flagellar biosynthesis component FlhA